MLSAEEFRRLKFDLERERAQSVGAFVVSPATARSIVDSIPEDSMVCQVGEHSLPRLSAKTLFGARILEAQGIEPDHAIPFRSESDARYFLAICGAMADEHPGADARQIVRMGLALMLFEGNSYRRTYALSAL